MGHRKSKNSTVIPMRNLILSPEAEQEAKSAYTWYEGQCPGLGKEFILCLDAAFSSITRNPQIYQVIHKNIRRALIRRFPYGVFYIIEPEHIQILAIFHMRRNPDEWKKRTTNGHG